MRKLEALLGHLLNAECFKEVMRFGLFILFIDLILKQIHHTISRCATIPAPQILSLIIYH